MDPRGSGDGDWRSWARWLIHGVKTNADDIRDLKLFVEKKIERLEEDNKDLLVQQGMIKIKIGIWAAMGTGVTAAAALIVAFLKGWFK